MHIRNIRIHIFVTVVLTLYALQTSFAQTNSKNRVTIVKLLDSLSNKHHVFFTYNSNLFKNKTIENTPFLNLSLNESIVLLQKITAFKIDYLGNSYYVIYSNEYYKGESKETNHLKKNQHPFSYNDSLSRNNYKNRVIKGVILSENKTPIEGVNIIENNTENGTVSGHDGKFYLHLQENNSLFISHIGYNSKVITPINPFMKITLTSGVSLDEIYLVGSRNINRTKKDAPVATDIVNIEKTINKSGLTEVSQLLQYAVPSFNATKQSGADGADHIVPATFRGLGPDQTLVLINGKRRHQASLINLYGTRGRGNSGTDLNTIPTSAIKTIEILKDGASAQYGSDAIAGVINLVLKDTTDILDVNTIFGFYNANPNINGINSKTKSIDGLTYKVDVNYGTKISNKGFLNISSEFLSKDHTFRLGTSQRQNYGDAAINNINLFFNAEVPINYKTNFYAFGGYNFRNTKAYAFTRTKDSERNISSIYPEGFNPLITSDISDKSFSTGIRTSLNNWKIDFNNTFGVNSFHYFIKKTLNATLLNNSPTEFDAGGHQLKQNTTSIDISKYFPKSLEGINLAFGLEHRLENYQILSGEETSYASYDIFQNLVTKETPASNLITHNNLLRPGGAQGFPGYSPINEVNKTRTNFSFYSDVEFDFTKSWMLGTALRYERYSDFGSTLNSKLATRFKISPYINLRSSISTGFRAPSLAQIYYNLTFTNYIEDKALESLLIANNSSITRKFGIDKLSEEKALNASLGLSTSYKNFSISLDSYFVMIKDRIILSGLFDANNLNIHNVKKIQFFANGVDTETTGIDLKVNWFKKFNNSKLMINLSGNINNMAIKKVNNKSLDRETFFGVREKYFLLASSPSSKFNLSINYNKKKLGIDANLTRYNRVQLIDWQIQQPLSNFNNSASERILKATDTYKTKYTLDFSIRYRFSNYIIYQFGVNNIFNTYPTIQGKHTDSGGLWDATQMGTNGAYYYSKIQFNL